MRLSAHFCDFTHFDTSPAAWMVGMGGRMWRRGRDSFDVQFVVFVAVYFWLGWFFISGIMNLMRFWRKSAGSILIRR
jgi:hypothetical protein